MGSTSSRCRARTVGGDNAQDAPRVPSHTSYPTATFFGISLAEGLSMLPPEVAAPDLPVGDQLMSFIINDESEHFGIDSLANERDRDRCSLSPPHCTYSRPREGGGISIRIPPIVTNHSNRAAKR